MANKRSYIQARDLLAEAKAKINDYDSIMGRVHKDYEALRSVGIPCQAFKDDLKPTVIQVTRSCWNHKKKHPVKRTSKVENLKHHLCFDFAF